MRVYRSQLVLGIMGFYTSLYMVSKLFSGGKKAAPEGKSVRQHAHEGRELRDYSQQRLQGRARRGGEACSWTVL